MTRLALFFGLLAAGCGRPVTPAAGSGDFPHAEDYETAGHGRDALAAGARCADCHPVADGDLVKGVTSQAPACQSCHPFPHDADIASGSVHGAAWEADSEACSGCHGEAGDSAPADVATGQCTACHSSYPHPDGFDAEDAHGPAVLDRGTHLSCDGCHGDDGASQDPACSTCHEAYPHAEGWSAGDAHGAAWLADASTCGERCHAADVGDERKRASCAACHDVFPHSDGWATAHAATTQRRGTTACDACHREGDLAGPALPVSCAPACHGGSP